MEPFYETSAFHEGVKFLNTGGKILCFGGRWGSGRMSTAKQVYMAVTKSSPIIISDPLSFDVSKHYEPIILDQSLSKGILHAEKELLREKICTLFKNMSSSKSDSKAFIIFKLDVDWKTISELVKSLVTKTDTKFIDLSKRLTRGDRTQILYSQFQTFCSKENFTKVENITKIGHENSLGYPEICALISRCSKFQKTPVVFCYRPLGYLTSYLENMHLSHKNKFIMLVYMSLNQMEIDVNNQHFMLFQILKSCNCDSTRKETKRGREQIEITGTEVTGETSYTEEVLYYRNKPKRSDRSGEDIISLIPMEFVNRVTGTSVYRLQHDVIKRMTLIVFGTYHFDKLLELSKPEELKTWVKKKTRQLLLHKAT